MTRAFAEPRPRAPGTLSAVDGALVLGVALAAGVAFHYEASTISLTTTAALALLICALCLYVIAKTSSRSLWSFPAVSLIALMIFHVGALPEFLYTDTSSVPFVERFIHRPESATAIWISLICINAYALGCVVASGRRTPRAADSPPPEILRSKIAEVGGLMTAISVVGWLLFAWRARLTFGSTYEEYLQAAKGAPLQITYLTLGLGISLAAIDFRRFLSRLGAAAFATFVVIGFPIGLRGEVLFPCAVVAAVIATRRSMPGLKVTLPVVILLLSVIAIVSQTRAGNRDNVQFSPMAGLSEMGSSLQVVSGAISWHTSGSEPFANGGSYIAPIADAVDRYLLREPVTPERQNSAYMSTQIAQRIGNVGGSIIGEAYHNFSTWGAAAVLFLCGYGLGALNRLATRRVLWLTAAIIASFVFQLLVRNSFASAPTVVLCATVALAGAKLLETLERPQRRRVRTRASEAS